MFDLNVKLAWYTLNNQTHFADPRDAHIVSTNIARRSIGSRITPRHNYCVLTVGAEQFAGVVFKQTTNNEQSISFDEKMIE